MRTLTLIAGLIASLFAADIAAAEGDGFSIPKGPCGSAEPAKQQRRKAGEGLPPLPLPATPMRRTERKRQPAPPPLIAKIQFGQVKKVQRDGKTASYHDWNKDPGDIPVLLNQAHKQLDVRYTYKRGPLNTFPADATRFPIFYYTGSDAFQLSDQEVEHLREFVRNGGTIWGDTCFGDSDFFKSFVREMSRVLPDRHFRKLQPRHPLFNSFYDIEQVQYTRAVPEAPEGTGPPVIYGMDLGCRSAIILSRYDLSCGWDGHIRQGAMGVHPNDARRLGINMISYSLATHRIGQYQSTAKVFYDKDGETRGDFQFAQAKLGENWDTQSNAIANLLRTVATETSAEVKFVHLPVDPGKNDLQNYPFLYMTGHHDFVLSETEVAALKRYLHSGGFVLGSPCEGSPEFDQAFRREIARVLPGVEMQRLQRHHPVYNILYDVKSVEYSDYMNNTGELGPPLPLEGVSLGSTTPVLYSPYGIGGGWRGFDHPFGRDIASQDALRLGVNIVLYSMTH